MTKPKKREKHKEGFRGELKDALKRMKPDDAKMAREAMKKAGVLGKDD